MRPATAAWSASSLLCSVISTKPRTWSRKPSPARRPAGRGSAATRRRRPGCAGWRCTRRSPSSRAKRQLRLLGRLASGREPPEMPSEVVDVLAAMRRLPATQREVLVLHYLVELTLDEVARHLGIPGGTAKSRLARGRRALASALGLDDSREDVRRA